MEDDKPKSSTLSTAPASRSRLKRLSVITVIALLVLAATAYGLWGRHASPVNNSPAQDLQSYKIPGSQSGRGIIFNKPNIYSQPKTGENTSTFRGFEQLAIDSKSKKNVVVSRLMVSAHDYYSGPSQTLVKLINDSIKEPASSDGYQGVVRNAQTFALRAFQQPGVKMDFGHAEAFSNNFIKSNAWKFSVSVTQPQATVPEEAGELLFMVGNHTAYYFFISAITSSWNSDSQTFQQTIDSIKIDQ